MTGLIPLAVLVVAWLLGVASRVRYVEGGQALAPGSTPIRARGGEIPPPQGRLR